MTDMQGHTRGAQAAASFGTIPPVALGTAMAPGLIQAVLGAQHAWLAAGQRLTEETFSFALHRIEAQQDLLARLAETSSPDEAARLQSAFWSKATSDYATEFKTLSQSVQDAWNVARKQAA
jgi:Phasin protein